jgi:hypothetical protein
MKASGLGTAPRKLLDEMKEIKSLDVLLPTRGKNIRLRVVTTVPKELKVLLQRMKVMLPSRPKIIENVVQKNALFKAQQAVITTTQFFNCGRWAKFPRAEDQPRRRRWVKRLSKLSTVILLIMNSIYYPVIFK